MQRKIQSEGQCITDRAQCTSNFLLCEKMYKTKYSLSEKVFFVEVFFFQDKKGEE